MERHLPSQPEDKFRYSTWEQEKLPDERAYSPGLEVVRGLQHNQGFPQQSQPPEVVHNLSPKKERKVLLLRGFLAVLVILSALAIGAGVAYAVTKNKSNITNTKSVNGNATTALPASMPSSTTSSSPNPSSSSVHIAVTNNQLPTTCPQSNGTIVDSITSPSQKFQITCFINGHGGDNVVPSAAPTTAGDMLTSNTAYTLEDCINSCSSYNSFQGTASGCSHVTWSANLNIVTQHYGNCWLKNRPGIDWPQDNTYASAELVSA